MAFWWVRYSYFNNEKFKLVTFKLLMLHLVCQDHLDIELSLNVFLVMPIKVEGGYSIQNQHQYTDQFINQNWVFLYSRKHFSWLPQAVSKILINRLSHKVSYASITIDPVINGFSPNELRSHFHIFDHPIITFG